MAEPLDESKILKSLVNVSSKFQEYLKTIQETDIDSVLHIAVARTAFTYALEKFTAIAEDLIVLRAVEAATQTEEYNYPLYLEHLTTAIHLNRNKLLEIIPKDSFTEVTIKLHFELLGGVELWGQAVNKVRGTKGLGKTGSAASHIWMEKIYRVDREGGKVLKFYKGRGKNAKASQQDITERYKGKYEETIRERLAVLDKSKAPFWYLIEHGNVSGELGSGVPYPSFGPTGFVQLLEVELRSRFASLLTDYMLKITREVDQKFEEYRLMQKEDLLRREAEEQLKKAVEGYGQEAVAEIEKKIERVKWVRQSITQVNQRVRTETYLVGTATRTIARDIITGQFTSLKGQ